MPRSLEVFGDRMSATNSLEAGSLRGLFSFFFFHPPLSPAFKIILAAI
jgi:hypothetical protein